MKQLWLKLCLLQGFYGMLKMTGAGIRMGWLAGWLAGRLAGWLAGCLFAACLLGLACCLYLQKCFLCLSWHGPLTC